MEQLAKTWITDGVLDPEYKRYTMLAYLQTDFIGRQRKTLEVTFEAIKHRLITEHPELPNPACFRVQTDLKFPLVETYLPVSKRLLLQQLLQAA
ncbi:MAG: hypothetical protein ACON34_02135 [Flavobacteriales bacterium]